jgi:hypothetical protein
MGKKSNHQANVVRIESIRPQGRLAMLERAVSVSSESWIAAMIRR